MTPATTRKVLAGCIAGAALRVDGVAAAPTALAPSAPLKRHPQGYLPVRTLNGWTLPYKLNGGVKEFHLVAEPVVGGRGALVRRPHRPAHLAGGEVLAGLPDGEGHTRLQQ